jgi:hypothetical protein
MDGTDGPGRAAGKDPFACEAAASGAVSDGVAAAVSGWAWDGASAGGFVFAAADRQRLRLTAKYSPGTPPFFSQVQGPFGPSRKAHNL